MPTWETGQAISLSLISRIRINRTSFTMYGYAAFAYPYAAYTRPARQSGAARVNRVPAQPLVHYILT